MYGPAQRRGNTSEKKTEEDKQQNENKNKTQKDKSRSFNSLVKERPPAALQLLH